MNNTQNNTASSESINSVNATRSGHPSLIISEQLFAHFEDGDGIFLVNEATRDRVFLHQDQLEFNRRPQVLDQLDDACNTLAMINAFIANSDGDMYLNKSAIAGLSATLLEMELKFKEAAEGLV